MSSSGREYPHFCPLARALDVVGERWSLLVVRDLLPGPRRFTDLSRTLGGITPSRLTRQLRALQEAGLVTRDEVAGRREVWYGLTDRGRDLAPAVGALTAWGAKHARRAPRPGESVQPDLLVRTFVTVLNQRGARTRRPSVWRLRFTPGGDYAVGFDKKGAHSSPSGDRPADVEIETTPEQWATFLMETPDGRAESMTKMTLNGRAAAIAEFRSIMEVPAAPKGRRSP